MALTLLEELQILQGSIAPPSVAVEDIIRQATFDAAYEFTNTHKVFDMTDTGGNDLATAYLSKMRAICSNVYRADATFLNAVFRVIVSIIGQSGATVTILTNATDADWATYIENNMLRTLEVLSGALKGQKAAYDALP